MATKIFYFTGTGNTLKLARDLAAYVDNAELIRISYDMEFDHTDCDTAGIAYPVYCFGLPNIVTHFIQKVRFCETAYLFGLSSYGGLLAASGQKLQRALKSRNYTLSAGFAVNMPGNATTLYDVPAPEKRQAMYSKEKQHIPRIADTVLHKETYGIDTNLGVIGKIASAASGPMMRTAHESDRHFYVDDTCNGCTLCAQLCPVGNIRMVDDRPHWQHKCECCMACFHWCPKASIQANKKTQARGRYHHPDITLEELLIKKA
ncbi:MAG: EFR1 family ferrodoxin [Fibrobacterota bacterium]